MIFVETAYYTKAISGYLSEEEHGEFQVHLIEHPDDGDVIKGTGGIRKIRWAAKGKGKSGGVRIIYYWRTAQNHIYLLTVYGKNEASNLTAREKECLKKMVEAWDQ